MTELAQVIVVMAVPATFFAGVGYLNRRLDRAAFAADAHVKRRGDADGCAASDDVTSSRS
jgi:hypothetical protein